MNPNIIAALKNASTSIEFKSAVEAIPQDEKYFTTEIRDTITEKNNLIAHASVASAVVSFLAEFSCPDSKRGLLRTAEIRDLFIDVIAPKISEADPAEKLGSAICHVTYDHKPAAKLYSDRRSLSAILKCFYCATTSESAQWIARSLNNICAYNPGANKILNDLPVVEAFSALIPHATTDDSVYWVVNSTAEILNDNEPAQKMFGTPAFLEKFRSMMKYAEWNDTKSAFNQMIGFRQSIISSAVLQYLRRVSTPIELKTAVEALLRAGLSFTAEIRDLIVHKLPLISDTPTALHTGMRDLIVDKLAPKVSEGDPIGKFGLTVGNIVRNKPAAELYANRRSLSAILDCSPRATTAESASFILHPIFHICNNVPGAKNILNDLPVVEAFTAIIPRATTDESVYWVSISTTEILSGNDLTQKTFGTSTFSEKVRSIEKHATTDQTKTSFKKMIDVLQSIADVPVSLDKPRQSVSQSNRALLARENRLGQNEAPSNYFRIVHPASKSFEDLRGLTVATDSNRSGLVPGANTKPGGYVGPTHSVSHHI